MYSAVQVQMNRWSYKVQLHNRRAIHQPSHATPSVLKPACSVFVDGVEAGLSAEETVDAVEAVEDSRFSFLQYCAAIFATTELFSRYSGCTDGKSANAGGLSGGMPGGAPGGGAGEETTWRSWLRWEEGVGTASGAPATAVTLPRSSAALGSAGSEISGTETPATEGVSRLGSMAPPAGPSSGAGRLFALAVADASATEPTEAAAEPTATMTGPWPGDGGGDAAGAASLFALVR